MLCSTALSLPRKSALKSVIEMGEFLLKPAWMLTPHQVTAPDTEPRTARPSFDGASLLLCICCPHAPYLRGGRKEELFLEGEGRKCASPKTFCTLRLLQSLWLHLYCRRLAGLGDLSHEEINTRRHHLPSPPEAVSAQGKEQGSCCSEPRKTVEPPREGSSLCHPSLEGRAH